MCTCIRSLLLLTLFLASLPGRANAQLPAGLHGTVRDEAGAVAPGAIVTARNLGTGVVSRASADARGEYRLPSLSTGEYEVEAVLPGFRSDPLRVSVVEGLRRLDVVLAVAPIVETVTVTRTDQDLATVAQAVDVVSERDLQLGQRKVSLAEGLRGIPGVFAFNRGNYSESFGVRLTLRAPMRGVGIGVRGIQMVQDGIPLTVTDGTTQPTNIDLGSTGRIEVIRGPSSVLYGNSAGGVVNLFTEFPTSRRVLFQPDVQFGSHGFQRQQLKVTGTVRQTGYLVNVSRMETDGYRQHSRAESRQANVVVRSALSPRTEITGVFNLFDMPFGESPSTLNLADARDRPTSVRQLAIDQGLGESSRQGQGGVTVERRFDNGHMVRTTGWGMWRDVWNPIPNRIVDLGRSGAGFRSEVTGTVQRGGLPIIWTAGADGSYQRDDSREFANAGVGSAGGRTREGARLVDQLEQVVSVAPFAQLSVAPKPQWMLTAGVRYDYYRFDADDRLLTNGDQSGGRTLDAFSPSVGVTYAATPFFNVYGTLATAYETPTTQELSNRPTGEGGFNTELEPEDLRSLEGGVRGLIARWHVRYDAAVYTATLTNALVAYQREDEQDFYRNAGESSRRGVELRLEWTPSPSVTGRVAYTFQRFRFVRFMTDEGDYSGHREPGAAPQQLFAGMTFGTPWLRASIDYRWVDRYFVDNANTFSNWSFDVLDVRVVWTRASVLNAQPFVGVDNLLNQRYNGSAIPNSFGNRFYEPAPGRELYGGLTFGIGSR